VPKIAGQRTINVSLMGFIPFEQGLSSKLDGIRLALLKAGARLNKSSEAMAPPKQLDR
jgi:hypothetical protein